MILTAYSQDNDLFVTKIDQDTKNISFNTIDDFQPSFYIEDDSIGHGDEAVRDLISNKPLKLVVCNNIQDYKYTTMRLQKSQMLYNAIKPEYQYIIDTYKDNKIKSIEEELHKDVKVTKPQLWAFDIETSDDNGKFSKPQDANAPITLLQLKNNETKEKHIFGYLHDTYKSEDDNTTYYNCKDEIDMIKQFILFYRNNNIILLYAWFGGSFDYPYLANRIENLGLSVSLLSYFGKTREQSFIYKKKRYNYNVPIESIWIDYVDVYKKITFNGGKESWAIDFIANYHNVDGKLSFKDHGFEDILDLIKGNYNPKFDKEKGSLYKAYLNREEDPYTFRTECYHVFVKYGELDVDILDNLEKKMKAFDTLFMLSKLMRVNLIDTLATTITWYIFSVALARLENKAIQSKPDKEKKSYPGGFVFAKPQLSLWTMLFDFNSLYPNNHVTSNISPDTIIYPEQVSEELRELTRPLRELEDENTKKVQNAALFVTDNKTKEEDDNDVDDTFYLSEDRLMDMSKETKSRITQLLKEENLILGVNGVFYTKEFEGFYPKIIKIIYGKRKAIQAEAHTLEEQIQQAFSEELKELIDDKTLLATVLKLLLNSLYGALGSGSFPITNYHVASSITALGRLSIKHVSKVVVKYLESQGYDSEIVQIDTDSAFLLAVYIVMHKFNMTYDEVMNLKDEDKIKEISEFCIDFSENTIMPVIDKAIDGIVSFLNCKETNAMAMGCEVIADKMVSTGKKRYLMNILVKDSILLSKAKRKITGIEIKRSDTPAHFKEQLNKAIDYIFELDENGLQEFVKNIKNNIKSISLTDIAKPVGATDVEKYRNETKGVPMHYRAINNYNKYIETHKLDKFPTIEDGDKIKYLFLRDKFNKFGDDVIAFKNEDHILAIDKDIKSKIDYQLTLEKGFINPLKRITDVLGWDLVKDISKTSLLFS